MVTLSNKKIQAIALFALILALFAFLYSSSLDIDESIFQIEVNNTNMAPSSGDSIGTGERVSGTTYYANETPLELFIWAHANTTGQIAELHLFINGTKVSDTSHRPLGAAESSNNTITAMIPRYSSYMIEVMNAHHYEWREYRVISGQKGSVSLTTTFYNITGANSTLLNQKVDKSGDNMTGTLNMTGNSITQANTISNTSGYIEIYSSLFGNISGTNYDTITDNETTVFFNTKRINISNSGIGMNDDLNMQGNNITHVSGINMDSTSLSYNYSTENNLPNGSRPISISINLSTSAGTNNATHVYTNGHSTANFTDLYITQGGSPLNFCLEENSTSGINRAHINVTGNGSVKIAYGNPLNSSMSNCAATNEKYHGYASTEFLDSVQNRINNIEYESIIKVDNVNSNVWWGIGKTLDDNPGDGIILKQFSTNAYAQAFNNSVGTSNFTAGFLTTGNSYRFTIRKSGNIIAYFINDSSFKTITTNLPDEAMGLGMNFADANGAVQQWAYLSPWYSSASSWATWGAEQTTTTSAPIRNWCVKVDYNGNLVVTSGQC